MWRVVKRGKSNTAQGAWRFVVMSDGLWPNRHWAFHVRAVMADDNKSNLTTYRHRRTAVILWHGHLGLGAGA